MRALREALEGGGAAQQALFEALAPFDTDTAAALAVQRLRARRAAVRKRSPVRWAPWAAAGALAFGSGLALTALLLQREGGVPYQELVEEETSAPGATVRAASPSPGAKPSGSPKVSGGGGTPALAPAASAAPVMAPVPSAAPSLVPSPSAAPSPSPKPSPSPAPAAAKPAASPSPSPALAPAPARASAAPVASARRVSVRPGDSLWAIAWRETGSPLAWGAIAEANGLRNPDRLRVGQVLRLPDQAALARKALRAAAAPAYVRVRPGESLWTIAAREYGTPYAWVSLYRANRDRLRSPDHLPAGLWLRRPKQS